LIIFETTPIAASMADQKTKASRRSISLETAAKRRTGGKNFLVSRGMAQLGEESFESALQPGERGIAALRLDQAHQEASWAFR
jgi:hypothetical protein